MAIRAGIIQRNAINVCHRLMLNISNCSNIKINQNYQLAFKSIRQRHVPNNEQLQMMKVFTHMVNYCIKIGLENNCSTLKKLSKFAYNKLQNYDIMSYYKLNAISHASGILRNREQSIKRGIKTKLPFIKNQYLANCYRFKINGCLLSIPYKPRQFIHILLNEYTQRALSDPTVRVRSFAISQNGLSLCIANQIEEIVPKRVIGIDRNLRNITVGNDEGVVFYKTNKLLSIKENTIHARAGFKRNDHRIKRKFFQKFNHRMQHRTRKLLHKISKQIVSKAKQNKSAIIFENLKGIRKLYRKGNGQGRKYRRRMNQWQFYELQRQVEYKAKWEGVPVVFVDPKRTSMLCPICGKRVQEDRENQRKLWCTNCMKLMDRDIVASLNIAYKGWVRFTHPRGNTNEACSEDNLKTRMQEPKLSSFDGLAILIVDVLKGESWK